MENLAKLVYDSFFSFLATYQSSNLNPKLQYSTKVVDDTLKSKYIDNAIFKYAQTNLKDVCMASSKVASLHVNIEIYHNNNLHEPYFINFLVFYTNLLVYILNKQKPQDALKQLDIYLLLTPFKKEFPQNAIEMGAMLIPFHINSGLTTKYLHDDTKAEVIVFREEEVCKVLLHELIHAMKLDCGCMNMDESHIIDLFKFPPGTNLKLNESYTDFLTCFINVCIYSCIHTRLLQGSYKLYKKTYKKLLEYESIYIVCKSCDVLSYCGFTVMNNALVCPEEGYKEQTHVFSYYIIKAILFCDTAKFLNYMESNNFVLKDYAAYVVSLYETRKYINTVKELWQKEILPTNLRKSLRMSNIDMIYFIKSQKDKLLKTLLR
jgi:hypothetical protein